MAKRKLAGFKKQSKSKDTRLNDQIHELEMKNTAMELSALLSEMLQSEVNYNKIAAQGRVQKLFDDYLKTKDPHACDGFTPITELLSQLHSLAEHDDNEAIAQLMDDNADHPYYMRLDLELAKIINDRLAQSEEDTKYDINLLPLLKNSDEITNILTSALLENSENQPIKLSLNKIEQAIRLLEASELPSNTDNIHYLSFIDDFDAFVYRNLTNFQGKIVCPPIFVHEVYVLYGEALIQAHRYAEAYDAYVNSLRWNPISPSIHLQIARILYQTQDYSGHEAWLEKVYPLLNSAELLSEYYFERGNAEYAKGNREIAARLYAIAKKLNGDLHESDDLYRDLMDFELPQGINTNDRAMIVETFKDHHIPFGPAQSAILHLRQYAELLNDNPEKSQILTMRAQSLEACMNNITEF